MNSRRKGKRGELQAAAYLRKLGFASARRGAQHRGGTDSPDVLADELPGVHIEVKHRAGIDLGTAELDNAMTQADADAGADRKPVVLWRRNRIGWRLTWIERGVQLTTCGDAEIAATLRRLNTPTRAGHVPLIPPIGRSMRHREPVTRSPDPSGWLTCTDTPPSAPTPVHEVAR